MKCPACGYEDEIQGDLEGFKQGEHGDFFAGKLTREHPIFPTTQEVVTLLVCPDCGHVFSTKKRYDAGESNA